MACAGRAAALPFVETDLRRPALGLVRAAEVNAMAWTTPTLVEICIGLEINGYLPAEF
jgi:coenzyme PQQ precursor peptide PqqA